ncbi:MAG: ArsA family ATPase [Deltaproteobacteria bacterium]|nr:ArsA family ATPase [Deltaproteobacteria bacterium]
MNLTDKRLILVVGKGGVGRSTVAAAIAAQSAKAGKKTLLYEVNANDRFGNYFDKPAVGTEIAPLATNLWGVNATPASALAEYGLMVLRWKSVYEMVFENRVTRAFLRAIPGLDDYALLGKAWYHTTEERSSLRGGKPVWDTVVFDMPASGHAHSMLRVPWVIVDTVPEGPLTRDARTVKALLTDPARTAAVLVTLAEEMPVNEAIELEDKLHALGIVPQRLIVNQVFPAHFAPGAPVSTVLDTLLADPQLASPLAEITAHASLSRHRRQLNERYLAEVRKRAKTPVSELPMVFAQRLGSSHIQALGERIAASRAAS